jgi:TatD DNase family protein
MPVWCDAHCHLQDPRLSGDNANIVAAMKSAGVAHLVVNATQEADWPDVARLADTFPGFVRPAFGIHPRHATSATPGWEQRLAARLAAYPQASVGECGIDGWIDSPDIDTQLPIFTAQLRIASEMNRPVTIHCLKAWGKFLEIADTHPFPSRFLMHSFGGSLEVARQLIDMGAYFSFSGFFLHPRKASTVNVFRHLPLDRVLVETDAPDMAPPGELQDHPLPGNVNHPANLAAIGRGLAKRLAIGQETLATATCANWQCVFG